MPASLKASSPQTCSVDYLMVLLQYAQQRGISSSQLLTAANIDSQILQTQNAYISSPQYHSLIDTAVQLLQEPALALALGQRQQLATHGALGYAVMSASSLEQALHMVRRFIRTRNRLIRFNFFFEGEQAVTQIEVKHANDSLYRHCVELAFSSMVSICNTLTNGQKQQCQIRLRFSQPDYHRQYRDVFGTEATFNADVNELRLPMSWFEGISMSNPVFAEIAQQQCEDLLKTLDNEGSLKEQVVVLLTRNPGYLPNQQETARQLGLSSRSLSRQLALQQTTYKKLLNQTRQQQAKEYLLKNDISVEDVAYLLGYESPPNFSRAFKRWTGLTPQQYRDN